MQIPKTHAVEEGSGDIGQPSGAVGPVIREEVMSVDWCSTKDDGAAGTEPQSPSVGGRSTETERRNRSMTVKLKMRFLIKGYFDFCCSLGSPLSKNIGGISFGFEILGFWDFGISVLVKTIG